MSANKASVAVVETMRRGGGRAVGVPPDIPHSDVITEDHQDVGLASLRGMCRRPNQGGADGCDESLSHSFFHGTSGSGRLVRPITRACLGIDRTRPAAVAPVWRLGARGYTQFAAAPLPMRM